MKASFFLPHVFCLQASLRGKINATAGSHECESQDFTSCEDVIPKSSTKRQKNIEVPTRSLAWHSPWSVTVLPNRKGTSSWTNHHFSGAFAVKLLWLVFDLFWEKNRFITHASQPQWTTGNLNSKSRRHFVIPVGLEIFFSGKPRWQLKKHPCFEDVFPIEHGDFPMSC